MIGTLLGHYRIERLLGSGGMGEVYLASDTKLGRQVALKVLSGALAGDPDRLERFEREARAAAALNHPNIVTIHSVEQVDGVPFLTLELVEGQTLGELIPQEGLSLDKVLSLGIPLADAVGAAHQRGITHRDLKPANVMVTADGRVKVLDFGLAKVKEEAQMPLASGMPTAALTGEGRIVGTVAYMSPEQAEGKPIDPRSDVFSLGIMLYEMATGKRPFEGDTHMSTLSAIIKDTPRSIADVRPGLPRELSKIINRCLAKDVEDRYQSAKDLRNDLRALKNELTSGEIVPITGSDQRAATRVTPAAAPARRPLPIVAAVVVLAAVVAGVMWWLRAPAVAPASVERPFDTINLTRLTTTGTAGLAAMSLDGRYVAHVSAREGQQGLWLRQIATTSNVEIVPAADARYSGVTFTPDGNHIYYSYYARGKNIGNLYQVGVLGGGARLILEDVDTSVTFSPDGRQFAFIRGFAEPRSAVIVANADGSGARELIERKAPLSFPLQGIAWSPDGRTIAVSGDNAEQLRGQIVLVDVASGTESLLQIPDWRAVARVAWLRDGSGLLVNAQESAGESSNQIFLVDYPSGTSRRLTNDLSSYSGLGVSPDGRSFVAIRNERRAAIWTMALEKGARAVPITAEASADEGTNGVAWTPDGRIVYATEASGNPDIWIMNVDGTRRVQLTSTSGIDVFPRVSADGRYIVFVSDRDGAARAWRMALDGSGATRLTTEPVGRHRVSLSNDSRWVYYDTPRGEPRKVSTDGGEGEPILSPELLKGLDGGLPPGFHEAMPAPDGSAIAGHYQTDDGESIAVISSAGGAVHKFDTIPPNATWTPDGRSFIYIRGQAGVGNLMRQPLAGGSPAALTEFASEQIFTYAISPDQKQVAIVRGRVSSDVVLVSSVDK